MIKRKYIFLEFLLDSTDSLLTSESSESVSDREIVKNRTKQRSGDRGEQQNFRLFDETGHVTSANICRAERAKSIVRVERVCEKRDRRKQSPFGGRGRRIGEGEINFREASTERERGEGAEKTCALENRAPLVIHGRVALGLAGNDFQRVRFVGGEQTGGIPVQRVIRGKIFRRSLRQPCRKNSR